MSDPWSDPNRYTHPLAHVERYGFGWGIGFDGWTTVIADEDNPEGVVPRVGDLYTYWAETPLSARRGQAIGSTVLNYLTSEQHRIKMEAEWAEREAKRREDFEASREEYLKRITALPDVFRERIAIRRENNPDFDWKYGHYELIVCEQAVLFAKTLRTAKAVGAFRAQTNKKQKRLVPGLEEGLSGNQFDAACYLARVFLTDPSQVPLVKGAMSPVVGSCEYGDVPPDHEWCERR